MTTSVRKTPRRSSAVLVAVLALAVPLAGQTSSPPETGSLAGFVLDPLDGGVPDVRVFLVGVTTKVQHQGSTNKAGYFEFERLPAGTYWVTPDVEFVHGSTITVAPNERTEYTVKMKLGHLQIHVGVCAECVVVSGNRTEPASVVQNSARGEEWTGSRSAVGPRMATPDRLFTLPYPEPLRERRIGGRVVVTGRIGMDGFVTAMRVVSTDHPELGPAAIDALKEIQWEPARVSGIPVEYPLTATIDFRSRPDR